MTLTRHLAPPADLRTAVPRALLEARPVLGPALRAAVDRLAPELRQVVAYHLGYTDAAGAPAPAAGGKAVRPALVLLSAEAAGAVPSVGLPGAVAVELVHNFSLLHDDVIDGDRERRHRPTAWAVFGRGRAIIAGDALVTLAHEILLEAPAPERVRAATALTRATARMIEGQAQDVALESRSAVSMADCLEMEANKTGALLSCAASLGAVLAGAPARQTDALAAFGMHLGLSFQAVDDLLGIWGRPSVTGKPVAGDLRQHKKSLPVVAALGAGTAASRGLRSLLAGPLSEANLEEAAALIERAGGRATTTNLADRHRRLALEALEGAGVPAHVHARFVEVAEFVTARDA